MKTDSTTKVLLGIIATGVAALTALAFEKRYQACINSDPAGDSDDATDHAYDRISRKTPEMGRSVRQEANSLKDRLEDGVDSLKEKAGHFKETVSDGLERAGSHLRDGAEKLNDGLRTGAGEVKDVAIDAAEEAERAAAAAKI